MVEMVVMVLTLMQVVVVEALADMQVMEVLGVMGIIHLWTLMLQLGLVAQGVGVALEMLVMLKVEQGVV
jgi:hypothetical protein